VRIEAPAAAGLLAALPPPEAPAVAIHSLGASGPEGRPVALTEWQSKKARDAEDPGRSSRRATRARR
jgi:hypothetical protein